MVPRWAASRAAVLAIGAGLLALAFVTDTVGLYLLAPRHVPPHADAVVVLAGSERAARFAEGARLAEAGVAPTFVASTNFPPFLVGRGCGEGLVPASVRVVCFDPDPSTTRGEAHRIAALGRRLGWRSIVVVATTVQTARARIRIARCFDGRVSMDGVRTPLRELPYQLVYEWGAMAKALFWQRGC